MQKIDMADKANSALHMLTPAGMTMGEIVQALDRFYENPPNLRIPIQVALTIVTLEANVVSKDDLDEYNRNSRSISAGEAK